MLSKTYVPETEREPPFSNERAAAAVALPPARHLRHARPLHGRRRVRWCGLAAIRIIGIVIKHPSDRSRKGCVFPPPRLPLASFATLPTPISN